MFQLEAVERRCMFSFTITTTNDVLGPSPVSVKLSRTGVLTIAGTDTADVINVTQVFGKNELKITSTGGIDFLADYGQLSNGNCDIGLVKRIVVNTGSGRDYVKVATSQRRITAQVDGGSGNDTLVANMHGATLRGGTGNDYLLSDQEYVQVALVSSFPAGPNDHFVFPPSSASTVISRFAATGNQVVNVSANPIRYLLNATANVLDGGAGNDRLSSRGSEDSLYGGTGSDSVLKLNGATTYFTDLPVLETSNTNEAPSRMALFGVEEIIDSQNAIEVIVRRSSIDG